MNKTRLIEIIKIANKLGWVFPDKNNQNNLFMQLEDVEKCMIAMEDDTEYERFLLWEKEIQALNKQEAKK